ncbi:MAG: hypothetical protein ACAF41_04065 [Leptolyngbya sp. BL-A-14]
MEPQNVCNPPDLTRRCNRHRKRSKRRAIFCPLDQSPMDSVSPKYPLYADKSEHLQQRGLSRKRTLGLMAAQTTVQLEGEWLEAFWCPLCQQRNWFHVHRLNPSTYTVARAPEALWQQVSGVIQPYRNPSVGEFTSRQARMMAFNGVKDFRGIR